MSVPIKIRMAEGCADLAPRKAHDDDAAFDLRARQAAVIEPYDTAMVPTGLHLELPPGFEAQVRPRSGLAAKASITILNSPGTVDSGYRGEVNVIMFNAGRQSFSVARGDRIAQMVIQNLPQVELVASERLAESRRGAGGFGSTGVN